MLGGERQGGGGWGTPLKKRPPPSSLFLAPCVWDVKRKWTLQFEPPSRLGPWSGAKAPAEGLRSQVGEDAPVQAQRFVGRGCPEKNARTGTLTTSGESFRLANGFLP